jgi:hypothetical protein
MSNVLESVRALWIRAQLKAPAFVQRAVIPRLHETKEIGRLLTRPLLPVYELEGQGHGGPLTVTYVGLDYTKPFLKDILFSQEPVEKTSGQIPAWQYNQISTRFSSDIVIVEAAKHLVQRLPVHSSVVFPPLIDHIVDVQGDWSDVRARFRRSVRKNELRWMRKYGYDYDVSYEQDDLDRFYHRMYLPTMGSRHGQLSAPDSLHMSRQYLAYGCLFRVKRDEVWVSGVLCYPLLDVLVAQISGVKDADEQLIREGATAATYHAVIHWANQQGYKAVNFLGSGARLSSGLFQHKRKWGSSVRVDSCLHRRIWLKVQRITPAVSQFLKANPLVILDRAGKLHGQMVVDSLQDVSEQTVKEWHKQYGTPGMSSLIARSVNSFAPDYTHEDGFSPAISFSLDSHSGDGKVAIQ